MKLKKRLQHYVLTFSAAVLFSVSVFAQQRVSGVLRSPTGEPLIGATVTVKGTNKSAATDASGRFNIDAEPGSTLVVSSVGFQEREIAVTGAEINEVMQVTDASLNEVVVIGYQTIRKRDVTGANVLVNAANARRVSAASIGESIQGLTPGVTVRSGGSPGQNSVIEIRGIASFINSSPLYVIDGMIADANSTINTSDVESIQILKDASAAAIYGSRAANGVVIVTTKKGRSGPPRVSATARYSIQQIPKTWDVMDAASFANLKRQAFVNSNSTPPANLTNPQFNTDWQDVGFRTGSVHDYNLGLSGGSANSTYYISGSYYKNKGVVTDYNFERTTFRVNTETTRGRFKLGENLVLTHSQERRPEGINPFYDLPQFLPIIPVQDASYITTDNPAGYGIGTDNAVSYAFNPVAVNALRRRTNEYTKAVGNGYVDVRITNWLNYRLNAGVEASFDFLKEVRTPGAWQYKQERALNSYLDETRRRFLNTLIEHTLNFNKTFGMHSINGVVGHSSQEVRREGTGAVRQDLGVFQGQYLYTLTSATGSQTNSGGVDMWYRIKGILGRVNYAYNDKYLLTISNRYDRDSRFAKDFRSGNFPSVAAAWRINKEKFFPANWVNDLKIRASYGELGIITVGSFDYLSLLNPYQIAIFGPGQTTNSGASQARLTNADITWERRISKNIGLDATLMDNRFTFSLDVYNTLSKDALINVDLPNYLGNLGGNPPVNAASIRNSGVEVAATYRSARNPFSWDVSANFTTIKNTVVSVGNQSAGKNYIQLGQTRSQIGRSIGEWYMLETNGLFQSQDEVNNYKAKNGQVIQPNAKPGDVIYVDRDGNGTINNDDRTFKGSPWPTLQTGAQFNASFMGFALNVQLVGVFGNEIYNDVRRVLDGYENTNFRSGVSPWSPTNKNTSDPRIGVFTNISSNDAGLVDNMRTASERWVENGSYLRLRNIELSYNLPKVAITRIGVSNARLFLSGQNLYTFTKYKGLDPDVVGANIQERGLDNGSWPASRIITIGVTTDF